VRIHCPLFLSLHLQKAASGENSERRSTFTSEQPSPAGFTLEDLIADRKALQPFPLRSMDRFSRIACVPARLGDSPQFLPEERGD
jgi:hypothetical protein